MKRALCLMVALALICSLGVPVTAQEQSSSGALSMIPADAVGFVCVQNLKKTDESLGAMIQELGLGPMLPIRSPCASTARWETVWTRTALWFWCC